MFFFVAFLSLSFFFILAENGIFFRFRSQKKKEIEGTRVNGAFGFLRVRKGCMYFSYDHIKLFSSRLKHKKGEKLT